MPVLEPGVTHRAVSRAVSNLGLWAALSVAVLNVAYFIAIVLYLPAFNAPWPSAAAYAAAFTPHPFVAWVAPCCLLALAFVMMIVCLHVRTEEAKKVWSLLALAFAVLYAIVLGTHYLAQLTVVAHNLANRSTQGLSLWLNAWNFPYNVPLALEGIGYSFLILSALFASVTFGKSRLEQWARWAFVGAGVTGLALPLGLLFPLPAWTAPIGLGLNGMLLTLAPVLLAILFARKS